MKKLTTTTVNGTTVTTYEYRGCTIKRIAGTATKHIRGKGWQTRPTLRWEGYDADGNFVRDRSKGRRLADVKKAIDKVI